MAFAQPIRRVTKAEHYEGERLTDCRSASHDGKVVGLAGGTWAHRNIAAILTIVPGKRLEGGRCQPYNLDFRPEVEPTGQVAYRDLSVICGTTCCLTGPAATFTNPMVSAEVLSDSSEAGVRGARFAKNRRNPGFTEYMLINQHEARIEQFVRHDDKEWTYSAAQGLDASLGLPPLGIQVALRDVVDGGDHSAAPLRLTGQPSRPLQSAV